MTLVLNYREVARANIERFDQLGAFHGMDHCRYHYLQDYSNLPNGLHCAIGVCDTEMELLKLDNEQVVADLVKDDLVTTDDVERLMFIQVLHDYRAQHVDVHFWDQVESKNSWGATIVVPERVEKLVDKITGWEDVTPELYREVMRRLAEEP